MEDAKKRGPSTPLDLSDVQSRPLAECRHLVRLEDFARPVDLDASAAEFLDSLPRILAGNRLRDLASAMARAHRESRSIIFAMGGHVVKVGMSPLIIDLMQRGLISALAVNGSFAIHDMEIALIGRTSERIEEVLPEGLFGMARETAEGFARAAAAAARDGSGLGAALGNEVKDAPHHGASVLAAAVRHEVPITVHVAIGTDTVHMHPGLSGADLGEASLTDFRILAGAARRLAGGVWVNVGSAVILPEVFLKVVSVLRNLGEDMDGITAADLDFVRHYRPEVNVMSRPASKGISLTGHHEILLPLLRLALLKELEST